MLTSQLSLNLSMNLAKLNLKHWVLVAFGLVSSYITLLSVDQTAVYDLVTAHAAPAVLCLCFPV